METLVNVGESLTLNAQLSDGDLSLPIDVKAIIKGPDANLITEVNLIHVGEGLFINTNIQMPEVDYVTAQYFAVRDGNIDRAYTAGLNIFRNTELIGVGSGSASRSVPDEIIAHLENTDNEYIVEVSHDSHE